MIKIKGQFILVGTSHVSKESSEQIKYAIDKFSPQVVGIELDYDRFRSLMSKNKSKQKPKFFQMVKDFGFSGAVFAIVAGKMQSNISKKLNIDAGVDMKTAYIYSRENKIPTSLIDINIKYTLRKISNISFFKKIKLIFKALKKTSKKDASKLEKISKGGVPDENTLLEVFEIFKKSFPEIYNILIENRNRYMVERLFKLQKNHQDGFILAVVGAGHVPGMIKLIEKKLKELELDNQSELIKEKED